MNEIYQLLALWKYRYKWSHSSEFFSFYLSNCSISFPSSSFLSSFASFISSSFPFLLLSSFPLPSVHFSFLSFLLPSVSFLSSSLLIFLSSFYGVRSGYSQGMLLDSGSVLKDHSLKSSQDHI